MKRIALTGPSGAGKGYVASLLRKRGFAVLDADAVVHKLYAGGTLPREIAGLFGDRVLTREGAVNRKELAEIVFSDKTALQSLNKAVHGAVRKETANWLKTQEQSGAKAAFVEAPQLFEAEMEHDFDTVVAVIADKDVRLSRICTRDAITRQKATARMENQMSEDAYRRRSHFTINNDGSSDLQKQIDEMLYIISKS